MIRKYKYIFLVSMLWMTCILLSGCESEDFYNWTVDYFSHREVTYIPEDTLGPYDMWEVDSNGLAYYLPGDGTAIVIGSGSYSKDLAGNTHVGASHGYEGTELVIPETAALCTVVGIGESAFRGSNIEKVVLPDTLCFIAEDAFSDCDDLVEIEWGNGLKEIGEYAFFGTGLSEIKLPETLEIVGRGAFGSTPVKKTVFPDSVKVIKAEAFYYCEQLADVEIGSGVCRIDSDAFAGTPWLENQTEDFVVVGDGVLLKYNGSAAEVIIEEGVRCIADAFVGHSELIKVKFSDSLEAIGDDAFVGCYNLEEIELPSSIKYIGSFSFGEGLKELFLPKALQYIDNEAFYYLKSTNILYEGSEEDWKVLIGDTEELQDVEVICNSVR